MARKKIRLPKLAGKLNERIVAPPLNIAIQDKAEWEAALKERDSAVGTARVHKLPELAKQLGWKMNCDLRTLQGRHDFFCNMAIELATLMQIRGFQVAKPKWRPEIVLLALGLCDNDKASGKSKSDLPACLKIVKQLNPDLSSRKNSKAAKAEAAQLRNRVSKLRAKAKQMARRQDHLSTKAAKPYLVH